MEVISRKQRKNSVDVRPTSGSVTGPPPAAAASARKIKARPAGILIDGGSDADFTVLVKKNKTGMDKNTVGDNRKTLCSC